LSSLFPFSFSSSSSFSWSGHKFDSGPFIEMTHLSLLNYLGTFLKNPISSCGFISGPSSVPLTCMSVFTLVSHCFVYCSL
jgi:hypothetical protein